MKRWIPPSNFDFDKAGRHLKLAEKETLAGQNAPNLLMIHAQDHVMTAQSELQ
ncbi:hypothetical protein BpJC7_09460 [Weizmannia acidilactici]|uniref:Uncharacterized protein n=1 Tax=Weizmannia acidilactici TaxID=2607726 RepID=A0A5J4JCE9_9BACI|nr:PTS lactose/cellobiose transporter subunit IIA [Weizmannia acidilactici]GER68263.1 hypothetical protein BpJC4_27340 [Weizmannia acidilactici]GER69643.1 hypothetical protein BpJC7_09460 [Weizmannia acidilactici]GER72536.1 hypothetical protein BpPP18_06030 [Weizmannia acidilactici]